MTRPLAGLVFPQMTSSKVVFPAPFGPIVTQLVVINDEVQVVERFEAVVIDSDSFESE